MMRVIFNFRDQHDGRTKRAALLLITLLVLPIGCGIRPDEPVATALSVSVEHQELPQALTSKLGRESSGQIYVYYAYQYRDGVCLSVEPPDNPSPHSGRIVGLNLDETAVDDDDLRELTTLDALKLLSLADTSISDAGLRYVGEIHTLEKLLLAGSTITDKGLRHLLTLPNLSELYLENTSISRQAIHNFEATNPKVRIINAGKKGC